MDFYQQETVEIDGKWYISVKGTSKAYDLKSGQQISYHIRENYDIFDGHVIDQRSLLKTSKVILSPNEKRAQLKLWLDKFAFIEIGTLLNSSPITDPIKEWQTQIEKREVEEKLIIVIYISQIPLFILLSQY